MSESEPALFTESTRAVLRGDDITPRQRANERRHRVYQRFDRTVQKDMPLLLDALENDRIDPQRLTAGFDDPEAAHDAFVLMVELVYELASATEGVRAQEVIKQGLGNRRFDDAQELMERIVNNPESPIQPAELPLLAESRFISKATYRAAFESYLGADGDPGSLTGADLVEAMNETEGNR